MNSAVDANGQWRVDRRLLALGSVLLSVAVVVIWPVDIAPDFVHDDAVMHLTSGVALTLALAATIPRRDDLLALAVASLGILWELVEWWLFRCYWGPGDGCSMSTLTAWLLKEDTLADMTLVALGALAPLIVIGRYK